MPAALVRLALLAVLIAATGCTFPRHQPGVYVSSDPAGARVYVDGEFTGMVTPAHVGVALDRWHHVVVEKPGYGTQSRMLTPNGRWLAVDWRHGYTLSGMIWFPLFLPWPEAIVPFEYESRLSPKRVHFYLRRAER